MPTLFISYKRDDKVAVTKISDRLRREFYYEIWIDALSIPGGEDWRLEIRKGIDRADVMLLMLTPDSCASGQVKEEVDYAKTVGRKIVPLMIKKVDNDDLHKLDIETLNYIDFVSNHDDRFAWEKLLDALPVVLPIHKRLLDPKFKALHHDYLRSLFARYGKVKLTYLLDAAPREQVSLFDVYVPLFLGIRLHGEIKDGELVDWWVVSREDKAIYRQLAPELEKAERRPKQFPRMQTDPVMVERIVERMKLFVAEVATDKNGFKEGDHYLWRLESEEAPALSPHLVITGGPGGGKSTLMQHLALCMAGDMLGGDETRADLNSLGFWQPLPAFTPVFIELRALVRTAFSHVSDPVTLERLYTFLEHEQLQPYGASPYLEDLKAQMREGGAMFFLDGLDEVPDAGTRERRDQIKAFVNLLRDHFPKCRIVITSRPYAYAGDWRLDDFGQVDLAQLDPDRLEELALKLFTVVLGEEQAKAQAETFKAQVERVPERLRGSPLFFTLMAAIWLNQQGLASDQRLPLSEDAIYRACVDMLVRRWTRKDLEGKESVADLIGLDERQLRQVLELLAYQVHSESGERDDAVFAGGKIFDAVRALKLRGVDFDLLEETLAQRAGVIYERDPNQFQFAHLSFQEHLSACYLSAAEHYPAQMIEHLRNNPTRWRNVMTLFPHEARQQGRDLWELVKTLLPKNLIFPSQPDSSEWTGIYYAAKLLRDHLPPDHDLQEVYRPRLQTALTKLNEVGALTPVERAEMGRLLAVLGDSRPGIGLRPDGLPDIDWVDIPAGAFLMGSDKAKDPEAQDNELPQQEVTLPAYRISKYPVTNAQFAAFVSASDGYNNPAWWTAAGLDWKADRTVPDEEDDPDFRLPNHPRIDVCWYEAAAFCGWLSAKLGNEVRLPTEVEWEKAARGTDGLIYPYGNIFDAAKGNTRETGIGTTSAVGLFPDGASPYGVLDMSGNVWEWCATKWRGSYAEPADDDLNGTDVRVLRGGSWSLVPQDARAARRSYYYPGGRFGYLGFRVVLGSPPTSRSVL